MTASSVPRTLVPWPGPAKSTASVSNSKVSPPSVSAAPFQISRVCKL